MKPRTMPSTRTCGRISSASSKTGRPFKVGYGNKSFLPSLLSFHRKSRSVIETISIGVYSCFDMALSNDTETAPPLSLPTPSAWPISSAMKKVLWIGLGFVVFLIAVIFMVPAFVDLGIFKRTYLPIIEEALHRRVDVGEVRLSLILTPSIRLSSLKVSDSPAFPDNTFFAAQQLQLRLKLWPLLRGHLEVTEFVLEKPVINLLK